jgi:hypothetical protein
MHGAGPVEQEADEVGAFSHKQEGSTHHDSKSTYSVERAPGSTSSYIF